MALPLVSFGVLGVKTSVEKISAHKKTYAFELWPPSGRRRGITLINPLTTSSPIARIACLFLMPTSLPSVVTDGYATPFSPAY